MDETPHWITSSHLVWHSEPALAPQEAPSAALTTTWAALVAGGPETQAARRMLARQLSHIRWPGETLEDACWKFFGARIAVDGGDLMNEVNALWDDGAGDQYMRFEGGLILALYANGDTGVLQEGGGLAPGVVAWP